MYVVVIRMRKFTRRILRMQKEQPEAARASCLKLLNLVHSYLGVNRCLCL